MPRYEYRVVPAPAKGQKAKGVKAAQDRFALSVEAVLNEMGAAGWEYLRAELLPSEERSGLTGTTTNWRNVLVFRRAAQAETETEAFKPRLLDAPGTVAPAVVAAPSVVAEEPDTVPQVSGADHRAPDPRTGPEDAVSGEPNDTRSVIRALRDNGQG